VSTFALATNRRWKGNDGEVKDDAQFHEVVVWGKLAEVVEQYLSKGKKVYIEGRLQNRNWEGQDGVKRNKTEIVATDLIMLDKKGDSNSDFSQASQGSKAIKKEEKEEKEELDPAIEEVNLDDIPF
ncbi:single-stranded DNA-binding protein, partial [bacterium]|nr:single-stranded DNA-binding protein [bacterium]